MIERALHVAKRDGADHITLTSGLASAGVGLKASHLMFLISLATWFSGVNRDLPKSFMGIGAFNLVRAADYRQCGGYEALRLTVVDDMKLGLLLRRAGKRTRGFLGADDVECHWGKTVGSMVKIMEKNYFAALDYRTGLVVAGSVFVILLFSLLVLGLLWGTAAGLAAALSPLSLSLPGVVLARRLGWRWPCAALIPFMFPVYLYALLNSTFATLRHRRYSLARDVLSANNSANGKRAMILTDYLTNIPTLPNATLSENQASFLLALRAKPRRAGAGRAWSRSGWLPSACPNAFALI